MSKADHIIKIGPHPYRVIEVARLQNKDLEPLCGEIDYQSSVIRVEAEMSPSYKRLTLWHEIIHGILENAAQSEHNEALLDIIAAGVTQVLQDNDWLRRI